MNSCVGELNAFLDGIEVSDLSATKIFDTVYENFSDGDYFTTIYSLHFLDLMQCDKISFVKEDETTVNIIGIDTHYHILYAVIIDSEFPQFNDINRFTIYDCNRQSIQIYEEEILHKEKK